MVYYKFFTSRIILAVPLPSLMPKKERNAVLEIPKPILTTVKEYTDINLNPKKRNI